MALHANSEKIPEGLVTATPLENMQRGPTASAVTGTAGCAGEQADPRDLLLSTALRPAHWMAHHFLYLNFSVSSRSKP